MTSEIENVPIEEASVGAILSTTGIYTCIAVLIILDSGRIFLFHSDPSCVNLENKGYVEHEVQKLIKESISLFKECENKSTSCFKNIFVIGGLNNAKYRKLNNELNRMKTNLTKLTPILHGLSVDELQNFIRCLVYYNTTFNLDGGNADAVQGNVLISDTTILADLTASPPLFIS
jgi:hypothetical protein